MKISFFHKSGKAQKFQNKISFFGRVGKDPRTDWVLICLCAFFLAVTLILLGLRKYYAPLNTVPAVSVETGKVPGLVDPVLLDKILRIYEKKAVDSQTIIRAYNGPSDPSIGSK